MNKYWIGFTIMAISGILFLVFIKLDFLLLSMSSLIVCGTSGFSSLYFLSKEKQKKDLQSAGVGK